MIADVALGALEVLLLLGGILVGDGVVVAAEGQVVPGFVELVLVLTAR